MEIHAGIRAARAILFAAAAGISSGCGIAPAEPQPLPARRVVLVSIDGLRADALAEMPSLSALRSRAQWTDSMLTVVPALTVPGHLSLFSGRDVTTFGVTSNALDESAAIAILMNGATSIFQWVRSAGGRSVAIIGGELVPAHQLTTAQSFFGLDALHAAPEATEAIVDQAIAVATSIDAPEILFVHVGAADAAGHASGWVGDDGQLTASYTTVVREIDAQLARLTAALEPALASGDLALAITADHGGGAGTGCVVGIPAVREHCTSQLGDRRIPFVLVGAGVPVGRIAGTPSITRVAPTLARVLRVSPPSQVGSGF